MRKSGRWKLVAACVLGGIVWNMLWLMLFYTVMEFPSPKTLQWQTVEFENCGSMRFPEEWVTCEQDGLVVVVDGEGAPMLLEIQCPPTIDFQPHTHSNAFLQNLTCLGNLSSTVYGNDAVYGRFLTEYDGLRREQYYLEFGYDRSITLLVWDDQIDERTVKDIAKTFVSCDP